MKIMETNFGNWYIQCIPDDGARISVLQYQGQDLLTTKPAWFEKPQKFYGEYETRPVYGYDDCFPTVDPCKSPNGSVQYRDHGELCWLTWDVQVNKNKLACSTTCPNPKVRFQRILEFDGNKLKWKFEVENLSHQMHAFLHVMHPLLPLDQVQSIELPEFAKSIDDNLSLKLKFNSPRQVVDHLFTIETGKYNMLLLRNIKDGAVKLGLQKDLFLQMYFDNNMFPTLGIWWNKNGYPVEDGLKRNECAFEPIPGTCSNLYSSYNEGVCLTVEPRKRTTWEIIWEMTKV